MGYVWCNRVYEEQRKMERDCQIKQKKKGGGMKK